MSTITSPSSITSTVTRTATAAPQVAPTQPTNGNSSNATSTLRANDNVAMSNSASALSTNNAINAVLSNIVGPRVESGNSGSGILQMTSASSSGTAAEDPAARFRSTEKVPLEGYDQKKLENPEHKTPKYIFGRVAQGFKLDSVAGEKGNAEELLRAMMPDLKAAGLEVVSVEKDRIQVKTEVGYEWVDVIRGAADKENAPGWQWGSEGKGTAQPTSSAKEWAAQTGGAPAAAGGGAAPAGASVALAGGGAAPAGGGAAASGPKFTPLGNQIDQSKVLPVLEKYDVLDIEKAVQDPEIQKAYPGAKVIPHPKRLDKIEFPNGAVVDCVVGAGAAGAKWGWMPEN